MLRTEYGRALRLALVLMIFATVAAVAIRAEVATAAPDASWTMSVDTDSLSTTGKTAGVGAEGPAGVGAEGPAGMIAQDPAGIGAAVSPDVVAAPPFAPEPRFPIRGPIIIPVPIGCTGPGVPVPTPPPPPTSPGPAASATYQVCPHMASRIPLPLQQYALANPHAIPGYGELRNPSVPANPWNKLRTWLELRDHGKPFSECNSVVWKAGCY